MDGVGIEKFAEYCYTVANEYVDELTDSRCKCVKVEVFEHENNSAIYTPYETQRMSFPEKSGTQEKEPLYFSGKAADNITKPPFKKAPKPAQVNTNNSKTTNKWVDTNSNNSWGI